MYDRPMNRPRGDSSLPGGATPKRQLSTGRNTFGYKAENLLLLDREVVQRARVAEAARTDLEKIIEKSLGVGPYTVVRKKRRAPSSNIHDYVSIAPYFWPDPSSDDGLPWIQRDGEVNPERDEGDCIPLFNLCLDARGLCLGLQLLDREDCGLWVERLLHTWFLAAETRMSPHLRYAQHVPGLADGRCWGLIDTTMMPGMLDAVELVADRLDSTVVEGVRSWVNDFATWFIESDFGVKEASMDNNHASWHLAQSACYLVFSRRIDEARARLETGALRLIEQQVAKDGRQDHELARSLSLSYSSYNIMAFLNVAVLARRHGVELGDAFGERLKAACDFILPYTLGERWPYEQIKPVEPSVFVGVFHWAHRLFGVHEYRAAADQLLRQHGYDQTHRRFLFQQ